MPHIDLGAGGGIVGGGTPTYSEVVLAAGVSTTGWVNSGPDVLAAVTVAAEAAIKGPFSTGTTGSYTQYLRFNPASPVALSGRPTVRVRHAWVPVALTVNTSNSWELVVSEGANFTGAAVTFRLPSALQSAAFIDYDIDVSSLTTVGCVGIRWHSGSDYRSNSTGAQTPHYIAKISLPASGTNALLPATTAAGDVIRMADYPAFVNSGDVTAEISAILGSLQPGDILSLDPWAIYEISAEIDLDELHDVEIRCNNACFYVDGVFNTPIFGIGDTASRLTIINPRVFGKRETTWIASLLPDVNANMARFDEIPIGAITSAFADWVNVSNTSLGMGGGFGLESGSTALQATSIASGDMTFATTSAKRYPAIAGVAYSSQLQVNSFASGGGHPRTMTMSLTFYNSGGTVLQTTAGTPITSLADLSIKWSPLSVTATAPANTAKIGVSVTITATAAANEKHTFDRLVLKRTTVPTNTVVTTTKVLASCGDGLKLKGSGTAGRQQFWARRPDGTNLWGFTIAGSAAQTAGALVRIIDLRTGVQVHAAYLDVPATATLVTLEYTPDDIEAPVEVQILNASTATPIMVTVSSSYEWGRVDYSDAGDNMSAFSIRGSASDITIENPHAEGVFGDAFDVTGEFVSGVKVTGLLSRCNHRQGFSVNRGYNIDVDDFRIIGTGRSAIDIEPFGSDWSVRKLSISHGRAAYCVNSMIAANNWALIYDLTITDYLGVDCGGGLITGGATGASFKNVRHISTALSGTSIEASILGKNMTGELRTGRAFEIGSTTGSTVADANGVFTTVYPDSNPELTVVGGPLGPPYYGWVKANTDNNGIPQPLRGGILDDGTDPTMATGTSTAYSGIIRADDPTTPFIGFDPGPAKRWWPSTFKGLINRNVHHFRGLDLKSEAVISARGMSATATRANNLRGIGAAVTQTATTLAVSFPGLAVTPAMAFDTPTAAVGTSETPPNNQAGTLAAGTYYYKVAEILEPGRGPGPASSALSVVVGGANNVVEIQVKGLVRPVYNGGNGYLPYGFTVYRGTSATVFTTQYDILPAVDFPSVNNAGQYVIDYGAVARIIQAGAAADRWWGWPSGDITGVAHSGNTVDQSGWEPDTSYNIQVTPSWSTTCWVTAKARGGFTINFGTAAPASATVDWFLVR